MDDDETWEFPSLQDFVEFDANCAPENNRFHLPFPYFRWISSCTWSFYVHEFYLFKLRTAA